MAIVYLNGEWLQAEYARISILDQGILRGDGLFETLRARRGKIPFLKAHWQRFSSGAKHAEIQMPLSEVEFESVLTDILKKNNLKDARLRVVVTRGAGDSMDPVTAPKQPTFFVIAEALPQHLSGSFYDKGIAVVTLPISVHNHLFPQSVKSISYFHNMAAKRHAKKKGAFEAIFVDEKGLCIEGSTSNLWWVKGGQVFTTPLTSGALPGTTRDFLIELFKKDGQKIREENLSVADLERVDEAWMSSSVVGIIGIHTVNNKALGKFPGPITRKIRERFEEELGRKS